jgi:hypothetical protein
MPRITLTAALLLLIASIASPRLAAQQPADDASPEPGTETIVVIRHAEKPTSEARGQLTCRGLNRALSLPSVLARFGHPAAIFAASPTAQTTEGSLNPWATRYSYVRPLATIEPYAILLDMPVNAQIAATNIQELQHEVLKPEYAHSVVIVAWEHLEARRFAEAMLTSFGQSDVVPHWNDSDYETIYVFRIKADGKGGRKLNFTVEQENLQGLPATCPTVAPPSPPKVVKPAAAPANPPAQPSASVQPAPAATPH